jgi:threonyl-tRNA synthetase
MMHCAVMGSIERFTSILIEHFAGIFPLWLAPVQIELLPIADRHNEFAEKTAETLRDAGIRVTVNNKAGTLQGKIRDAALQKVPYLGIIGDKEIESDAVSVRLRSGEDQGQLKISDFLKRIKEEIDKKA